MKSVHAPIRRFARLHQATMARLHQRAWTTPSGIDGNDSAGYAMEKLQEVASTA